MRGSWAVLYFVATTHVGRRVPAEEQDVVSAVSKLDVRVDGGAVSGDRGDGRCYFIVHHLGLSL